MHGIGIQRQVAIGTENRRKMRRLDFSDTQIGVGHRQRAAAAITGGTRIGAGGLRPHPEARAVEMQDRTTAGRHGVDRHHRCAHAHARHRRLERAFERTRIQRDVGRGAAHVETDDMIEPRHRRGARRTDDAAGRAGQDRVLALETMRLGQPAIRLHEEQPNAFKLRRHVIDIAAQDRREIGIHHRGIAARDQPHQRADHMAGGDLGEPRFTRQLRQTLFVRREFPRVHQHDGAGGDAGSPRFGERGARGGLVDRFQFGSVRADPAGDFNDPLVQHRRQPDRQIEQPRPRLIADAQRVGEATIDHQKRALALALQQRVGGNGGAHLHAVHNTDGDRRIGRDAQHRPIPAMAASR